jgi:signal transduction histidine kinase/CheY-like chemotaxis protein
VYVPSIESLKPGQARSALAEAGIRGWAFICGDGQTETRYSLGFEALNQAMTWPADQIGLLRMAVNTFAGAVGRARLEGERARLQTSLEGARRMETVGALTSGIAHNFNNIIGAILGHTEMLETEYAAESRLARHVAGIRLAAERARDLVEELLNFGRQRVAPQQQISLRTLVSETQSLLAASLPRNVQLSVGEASAAAIVRGNPTQLQQVVINLCNNAAQAMGYAGRVELTINMRTVVAPAQLSHGHLSPGSYVRIAVRDRGRGIDDATLAHLFEPFFTTRAEGTGLGLATVREIVGNHGGALNVTSQLNEGSFFEVWLPAVVSETSADALDYPPVGGKGETVLILNEDKDRILHDEELVAALGYEPVGFTDAATALTATRTNPDRFDLFLIARIEPVSEALSVARKLHSVSAQLPILMVTPTEALGAQVLAQAGVREVIGAPLTSCDLALALQRHLSSVRSDQHA